MDIQDKSGLRFRLKENDRTASVISSPDASGSINIPRIVKHENINYKIVSIEKYAFSGDNIQSVMFPEDSEVRVFKAESFCNISISVIKIPPKLEKIESGCFFNIQKIDNFIVSQKNHHFSYIEKSFLVENKPDGTQTLIYLKFDIEKVIIPPSIKIIRTSSLSNNKKLTTLYFDKESKIESFKYGLITENLIKLGIPKNVSEIDQICFQLARNLQNVSVSSENKYFTLYHNLLMKKTEEKNILDLIFCPRNATNVIIPKYIKKIASYAFSNCIKINQIIFDSTSKIETIEDYAFYSIPGPKKITFPPSLKKIGSFAFYEMINLTEINFLSEEIEIMSGCFFLCENLKSVTFSKVKKLFLEDSIPEKSEIIVLQGVELDGPAIYQYKNRFKYIGEKNTPIKSEISLLNQDQKNEYETRIKQLESENAELRKKLEEQRKKYKIATQHLKKFIKNMPSDSNVSEKDEIVDNDDDTDIIDDASDSSNKSQKSGNKTSNQAHQPAINKKCSQSNFVEKNSDKKNSQGKKDGA